MVFEDEIGANEIKLSTLTKIVEIKRVQRTFKRTKEKLGSDFV